MRSIASSFVLLLLTAAAAVSAAPEEPQSGAKGLYQNPSPPPGERMGEGGIPARRDENSTLPQPLPPREGGSVSGSKGPVLAVEPGEVVLDHVYAGQKAEAQVRLTNDGDAPLVIQAVRSSCGCTTTGLQKQLLQPGESAAMTVEFRASRRQAGRTIEKKVTITSNDQSGHASLVVPVIARVVAAITVEPAALRLDKLPAGSAVTREIVLTASDGTPFEITSATGNSRYLRVTTGDCEASLTHTLAVEVRAGAAGAASRGTGAIEVETTHPRDARISIPVSWRIERLVAVKPRTVALGRCHPGQSVTRTITVKSTKRGHFEELSFRLEPGTVPMCASRSPDEPDAWELTFDIPIDLVAQRLQATLLIDTHSEPEGTIEVPVSGIVSEDLDLLPDLP